MSIGHFYKLIYSDFEVYIEEIAWRNEGAQRAMQLTDNEQYTNKKPKAYKNVNV